MKIKKHFSLAQDNPDHYVVHDSRDNTTFPVAKHPLGDADHKAILKMPKYADGGEVSTPDTSDSNASVGILPDVRKGDGPPQESRFEKFLDWTHRNDPDHQSYADQYANPPTPQAETENVSTPDAQALSQAPAAPTAPTMQPPQAPNLLGQYNANQAQEVQGLQDIGKAKTAEGNELAQQYDQSNALQQGLINKANDERDALNWKADKLAEQVANSNIDPKNYVHNMSTGNKILAAISLAVSGLGAGLSGQPNIAAAQLQKSINDDIDAQKTDLGKKQSLLSENLKRFGDLDRATQVTQMQMNALAQGQIAKIAAKNAGPLAVANAKYLSGQLKAQNMINSEQFRQTVLAGQMKTALMSGQFGPDTDPATLVEHIVAPERRAKVYDEIEAAQNTATNGPKILQSFDKAASNIHAVDAVPGIENADQKSMHTLLGPTFKDVEGTVRQAAMDNIFKNTTPQFGDDKNTIKTKRDALVGYLSSKSSAPTAKGNYLDLRKFKSTNFNPSAIPEGTTASNATGHRIVMKNGQWVPVGQ